MNDKNNFALVSRPMGAVEKVQSGAKRVLSRMVSDALSQAKEEKSALAAARFQIGEYELREPDYRQILIWAKALALEPEEVIQRLRTAQAVYEQGENELNCREEADDKAAGEGVPIFTDGAILKLYWDFELLPLEDFEWVAGLKVEVLFFFASVVEEAPNLRLNLPHLRHLTCQDMLLSELDLSGVPRLSSLVCSRNRLTKLDLSKVTELTTLECGFNPLIELNLSGVPKLRELDCMDGRLNKLDLSPVPQLEKVSCFGNQLDEVDTSGLSLLNCLWCGNNQLSKLDLSSVPMLETLMCFRNRLVELDLSKVPKLTTLGCGDNCLAKIDIRSLPGLQEFSYKPDGEGVTPRIIQHPDQHF